MPNFRQIHVSIWKDSWFLDLEPDEKLLFIYLFSNESTSLSGIYKLPTKVICFETGIDSARFHEIMDKFAKDGKVYHEGDIIWTVNMRKFHATKSIKVIVRISNDIDMIPDCELKKKYIAYHSPKIPYPYPSDTQPQLKEDEYEKEDEKEDEKYNDEPFRILYDAFLEATNMHETMLNGAKAVDEITKRWIPGGVTPDEVRNAAKELLSKDYNISGPWSLTNSINMLKAKGSKKVDKPVAWEVFG